MIPFIPKLYLPFLIMIVFFVAGCKNSRYDNNKDKSTDSTSVSVDTMISDVNWTEEVEEARISTPKPKVSYSSSGGGGGAADNDADVQKYRSYERDGDSPEDFAKALIYPAIRMVYSDNFAQPKARVLQSDIEGERYSIKVAISWKDHWVPNFEMEGSLEINKDGSNATFTITDKNEFVESLEFTEDSFKNQIKLPNL